MNNIERDDLIWLSGLFEGEAWFGSSKTGNPRLSIECTDRDVAGRAAMMMEGNLRARMPRNERSNPTYVVEISGDKAADLMELLLPFMGARRSSKIIEILYRHGRKLSSTRMHAPLGMVNV